MSAAKVQFEKISNPVFLFAVGIILFILRGPLFQSTTPYVIVRPLQTALSMSPEFENLVRNHPDVRDRVLDDLDDVTFTALRITAEQLAFDEKAVNTTDADHLLTTKKGNEDHFAQFFQAVFQVLTTDGGHLFRAKMYRSTRSKSINATIVMVENTADGTQYFIDPLLYETMTIAKIKVENPPSVYNAPWYRLPQNR